MDKKERKILYEIYKQIIELPSIIEGEHFIKNVEDIYDKLQVIYAMFNPQYYPKDKLMAFEDVIHNEVRFTWMAYQWFRKHSHLHSCQTSYITNREKTIEKIHEINHDLLCMVEELKKDE